MTERLLKKLNSRGNLHCVPAALHDKYVIRFTVTSQYTTNEDILKDWHEIRTVTNEILTDIEKMQELPRAKVPLKGIYLNENNCLIIAIFIANNYFFCRN